MGGVERLRWAPPELRHRTAWHCVVERSGVAAVNGGHVGLVVVALEMDITDAAAEEVGHAGDLRVCV